MYPPELVRERLKQPRQQRDKNFLNFARPYLARSRA
jgi:hypothetical protein